ncbi:hypothetical protein JDF658_15950 [Carboxydocella sp. JDF658]|nr:thioredoxin domain-containing protein [Carboxydocella sporoproducens]GAW31830.1 hypothetical protein JDF658_15950 [Carboxydocella sp. JDF658]
MEPVVLALQNKYAGQVEFLIVNVDDPQGQQLAAQFGVSAIPAFFFINSQQQVVASVVGAQSQAQMEEYVKKIIP